jgi:thymidylate synthase
MNNLDKQYQALLKDILSYGVTKNDRTGTGTKSIFGYMIHHNMQNGFPLLTTKKVPFKTMATELMWFLMGDTNIKYLVENGCNIWNGDAYKGYEKECDAHGVDPMSMEQFIQGIKNSNQDSHFIPDLTGYKLGDLGPIYGAQWRNWTLHSVGPNDSFPIRVDQIKILIEQLKTNPDSRRLMVNAWNVGELDEMTLPPCHYGFQVYTREGEDGKRYISLSWNQRSVDVFLGLPFNIASYGLLLEMIAREVNMVPEHLIGHLGDTHLYSNHLEQAQEQLERIPRDLPIMKMSSGHNFRAAMAGKVDEIDINDFMLVGYNPHPSIKAPLSN